MPTTANDAAWLRRFTRLILAGAVLIGVGYLINPRKES